MDKKVIIAIAVVIAAVFVGGFIFRNIAGTTSPDQGVAGSAGTSDSGVVFYYGAECPHCKDVESFIAENKIADKVSFQTKEVWHDQTNATEMSAKATTCGLAADKVGVPFLFADGKCYVGTPDVEGYFREKAGLPAGN
ncbi:MAG: hypothetical protein WCJ25_04905 [Candidatus Moraniibacteriota bacterium]